MIHFYAKFLLALLLYNFLICDDSIEKLNDEKNRIEKEIKERDEEIEILNKDLELIRNKITNTTSDLNSKTRQAIKGQKDLIDIQKEIEKVDSKLASIESEINETDNLISKQKNQIVNQESEIDSIEKIIDEIILKFKERAKKTYQAGIKKATSWKEKKYLKELSQHADKTDLNKEEEYLSKLLILERKKVQLEQALKDFEITLINKKRLLDLKKKAKQDLIKSKDKKNIILSKLKREKESLETELNKKKHEEQKKQKQIKTAQQIIEKLIKDKETNKKRREDLIRFRLEQNKEISGNFSKMKGKLQWPVNGTISQKFGLQKNKELHTFTENPGIEIRCTNNSKVESVMDGIVMHVGYIGGYGNVIMIDHGEEYSTVYGNVDEIYVYEDDYVSPGKVIGKMDYLNTNAKVYLHFEVWHNGKTQNPELWLKKK